MTRKLIDSADALNIIIALIRYLSKSTEWSKWISWAKRRIDELPETENAVISDISNIVVGTIENDSDDDATKINKIKEVLIDYYRGGEDG
jgi:hypothetical protein